MAFLGVYLVLVALLSVFAFIVFRRIVRRDYLQKGRLTWPSSTLQLLAFAGILCFPYLFNPHEWALFWELDQPASYQRAVLGFALIVLGFLVAFGTMAWFGLGRAFGFEAKELASSGPYRLSRNPQILGGYLLVIGCTVQYPSWYSLGWIILYGIMCHWMILSEEEHLQRKFGEQYRGYCEVTPRYLLDIRSLFKKTHKEDF